MKLLTIICLISFFTLSNCFPGKQHEYDFLIYNKWNAVYGIEVEEVKIIKYYYSLDKNIYKNKFYTDNSYLIEVMLESDLLKPIGNNITYKLSFRDNGMIVRKNNIDSDGFSYTYNRYNEEGKKDDLLTGQWSRRRENSIFFETRLVTPDNYVYVIWVPRVGLSAISEGWHLLKYVDENIFESDETFGGDKITVRIFEEKLLIYQDGVEEPLSILPVGGKILR